MPSKPTITQTRLNAISTCLLMAVDALELVAMNFDTPFLAAISNTTQSILECAQKVKRNQNKCTQLLEHAHALLHAIMIVHFKSTTLGELPLDVLQNIGKFTQTMHKIHAFVEMQENRSKLHNFFHQAEMNALLKDCEAGLAQGREFFQTETGSITTDISQMQHDAGQRHQEVLKMIEALSDTASSDRASTVRGFYLLVKHTNIRAADEQGLFRIIHQIFHGRESELSDILRLFRQGTPRIAILGSGGMGKTTLAQAVLHHFEISVRYEQHRFFVACDSASSKVELAAVIGSHLGLKPGRDLTQSVVLHFTGGPSSLLILDNLETLWEPTECRADIEEFISLITDVEQLALIITMRGAERPGKIKWTRPFIPPLKPLNENAARQTFIDVADDSHNPEEVDKVLSLTDNMPLAINLIAHLVDSEGCSNVLARWDKEKTSMISAGHDKRSNLDLSISLSLASPRLNAHSRNLLSLLSMLPDVELIQSKLPLERILECKVALICTSLAYSDEQKRLKALVPIREYMTKIQPPPANLIHVLLNHFLGLLQFHAQYHGTKASSGTIAQISANLRNIQNVLLNGLQHDHPDLRNVIYCIFHLNLFNRLSGRETSSLISQLHNILPHTNDHRLKAYFITELFLSANQPLSSHGETLMAQALEYFSHFDDPDLECKFYIAMAQYQVNYRQEHSDGRKFCQRAISLAQSTGNTKRHCEALRILSALDWELGDYSTAQMHACEVQRLARISADLLSEATGLHLEAMCLMQFCNYKRGSSVCKRARHLLNLCGLSGGNAYHHCMIAEAEIHKLKSEYNEARSILMEILAQAPVDQDSYDHGYDLLNLAEVSVFLGAPKDDVERYINASRKSFEKENRVMEGLMCDSILGDLYLREEEILKAMTLLEKCVRFTTGYNSLIPLYCMERLGNTHCWPATYLMSNWTIVFLTHAHKLKQNLCIHKALQFLGDTFCSEDDDDTAISLFTIALEGFTVMDVQRSRAECMLRLGDISNRQGDLLKAVQLWDTARPLFKQSSQTKQAAQIDKRLANVSEDVLQEHQKNLAKLAELNLNAPTGIIEEVNDDSHDIEDQYGVFNALGSVSV